MKINELAIEIYKIILRNIDNQLITNNQIINHQNFHDKISDYIFMCFILGNDFIPHSPSINIRTNGLTILLELYKKLFSNHEFLTNTQSKQIYWNNFKKFIKHIAENEEYFIQNNCKTHNKNKYFKNVSDEDKIYKYTCENIRISINIKE